MDVQSIAKQKVVPVPKARSSSIAFALALCAQATSNTVYADPEDGLGPSLCPVGDVDGDGIEDVLVMMRDRVQHRATVVSIGKGSEVWSLGVDDVLVCASLAQDFDADGVADVLIGSRKDLKGEAQATVHLLSGKSGEYIWKALSGSMKPRYAFSVSAGRDFDRDGVPDIICGLPPHAVVMLSGANGSVFRTLKRPTSLSEAVWVEKDYGEEEYEGGDGGGAFGTSVIMGRDFDGDRVEDLLVGSPDAEGYRQHGAVYVFSGISLSLVGVIASNYVSLGWLAIPCVDMNGDKVPEILIAAVPFGAGVYSGKAGAALHVNYSHMVVQGEGASAGLLGDVNGDGIADYVVGANMSSLKGKDGWCRAYSGGDGAIVWEYTSRKGGLDVAAIDDYDGDKVRDCVVAEVVERALVVLSGRSGKSLKRIALAD